MVSTKKVTLQRWVMIACFGSIAGVVLPYSVASFNRQSRRPKISLDRALQTAQIVFVAPEMSVQDKERLRIAMNQGVQPAPSRHTARLHKNIDAMFPVFTSSGSFHTTAPRTPPDYAVTIYTSLGVNAYYDYSYVSATGELGSGQDWCRVPPEFREWLLKQIANAPKDQPAGLYPQSARPFAGPPR